jgi:hypothetical protein
MHEDPRERRGDRTWPGWAWAGWPKPAGLAQFRGRFGPLSLHPKDLQRPGGAAIRKGESHSHREAIHKLERGGRSPEEDRPSRRKHPQVEKKEDTVGSVTMINGAMSSTLMG